MFQRVLNESVMGGREMPVYSYRCKCGGQKEVVKKVAELDREERCYYCGGLMERVILHAPNVQGDYPGYECPVTGRWIEGRKAHQENLERHGCRVLEKGETEDQKRRLAEEDQKLETALGDTVGELIAAMPVEKVSRMAEEAGKLDFAVERGTL